MEVEFAPEQPPAVVRAVAGLLAPPATEPDSWWQEGIEEALYGEETTRPRSTLGADLA